MNQIAIVRNKAVKAEAATGIGSATRINPEMAAAFSDQYHQQQP